MVSSWWKYLYFIILFRKKRSPFRHILTTIISEGSKTMHSQPRLKLPAERLPKLEGRKKNATLGQPPRLKKHQF